MSTYLLVQILFVGHIIFCSASYLHQGKLQSAEEKSITSVHGHLEVASPVAMTEQFYNARLVHTCKLSSHIPEGSRIGQEAIF